MTQQTKDKHPYFAVGIQVSAQAARQFALPSSLLAGKMGKSSRALQLLTAPLEGIAGRKDISAPRLNLLRLMNRALGIVARHYLDLCTCSVTASGIHLPDRE